MNNRHRIYRNDEITVLWRAEKCCHSGNCVRNLPGVFSPARRPWIDLSQGTTRQIVETVDLCPSGALTYVRNDRLKM